MVISSFDKGGIMVFLTELFELLVIANVFLFIAIISTQGKMRSFFAKIFGISFVSWIIITSLLVRAGVFK